MKISALSGLLILLEFLSRQTAFYTTGTNGNLICRVDLSSNCPLPATKQFASWRGTLPYGPYNALSSELALTKFNPQTVLAPLSIRY
jgi:hypothetical protein